MGRKCGNMKCDICNVFYLSIEFESTMTEKKNINFKFDCNSINVTCLVTCKICRKQYLGSTAKKFCLRFIQYKSNITLYIEGQRGFKHEKIN